MTSRTTDSVWGTKEDPTYSKPLGRAPGRARRPARRAWFRSLHARFDLVFHDVADRDAGFREKVLGDGGKSAWTEADFTRRDAYLRALRHGAGRPLVAAGRSRSATRRWTRPGRTTATTASGYWLGSRGALCGRLRDAGVAALLFGAGADGCTTAQTDGGLFFRLARAYEARAAARLR